MKVVTVCAVAALAALSALLLAIGLPSVLGAAGEPGLATPPTRPNVILVLTDDLDAASLEFAPRIKALLTDRGTSFSSYFVNVSLCCPSRATILRGQYAHNHRVVANEPPKGGFKAFHDLEHERSTVATWLQAAGYRTMLLGKYLNGYPEGADAAHVPPGWDDWHSPVRGEWHSSGGGEPYSGFSYTLNVDGSLVKYGNQPQDYLTDVLAGKATDLIQQAAVDGRPFFLYLAPYAPHWPAAPAPRHRDEFPDAIAPRVPSFDEADMRDKPVWMRARRPLSPAQIAQIDELYRRRLQSMLAVDELIETLVQTLEATGQLANTYIVFTSDNGVHQGQHRRPDGKAAPYEEDIRVPLIVRGPAVAAGRTVEHLAGNVDLAPTLAELAGAAAPELVDGRSLAPLLHGDAQLVDAWRDAFLLSYESPADQPPPSVLPTFQGLRTRDSLYVEYVTGERELYDLRADPDELQNAYATADPTLLARLSSQLAALRQCAGASCRAADASAP